MKAASAGKYARAFMAVAASRDRSVQASGEVARAAEFFASSEGQGAADVLQSSRVPRAERRGLLKELARALSLGEETEALVHSFATRRALESLGAVAERARTLAVEAAGVAPAELRTAHPLSPDSLGRITAAAERILGRQVELTVTEDASLVAGVVLRAGNRIWDGSLAGALARAGEALSPAASGGV